MAVDIVIVGNFPPCPHQEEAQKAMEAAVRKRLAGLVEIESITFKSKWQRRC